VTTTSTKPDASSSSRAARYPDLSARLKARLRPLRARLARRDTLVELIHQANASRDPRQVALWLIRQAADWIPAPVWAVVARDVEGAMQMLATQGGLAEHEPAIRTASTIVLRRHVEYASADLSLEPDALPDAQGTVLALPLFSDADLVGVLVGLDPAPSAMVPSLGAAVDPLLRSALDPAAIALDNALRLERAEALSVTDDLTRLYNARYLHLALRRESKLADRTDRPVSLLFLDLDGFKVVNDRHGHLAGSKALVEVGAVLKSCARETDIVARFGGDEFAVVLPDTATPGAVSLAERIRAAINGHMFLTGDGLSVRLTASIGIATLPGGASSAEDLLRVADTAMYRVKAAGKNGIQVG
jgi:diguanylate cyclase (GGDEF)-like protein